MPSTAFAICKASLLLCTNWYLVLIGSVGEQSFFGNASDALKWSASALIGTSNGGEDFECFFVATADADVSVLVDLAALVDGWAIERESNIVACCFCGFTVFSSAGKFMVVA